MSESLAINSTLSHYRILQQLGAGGMGEVYLAEDTQLHRKVAIKFLPPESTADERARKRLVREAQAAAALDHPNICSIYEVGGDNGRSFIVMQYVEGETLDVRMKRKPLDLSESFAIAAQVADALAEAHAYGIIHRDIKPSNIIITSRGQAKVMDFGLAKVMQETDSVDTEAQTQTLLTAPDAIPGTVPYMSPEQLRNEQIDARSDIFSFGATLYEMVCGRQPFASESAAATVSAILTREPPPLARFCTDMPEELQRIIRKCLEKDRERRYQTMRDLALDLDNCGRQHETARATVSQSEPATAGEALTTKTSEGHGFHLSRRRLVAGAALLILAVAVALAYLFVFRSSAINGRLPEIKSLAVLPLDNFSGDPSQDYFADGMTEAMIAGLAKISALRVISRTSVMQYKGGGRKRLPEIARELNVDAVIEGSVQRAGDRVRITAQLIYAPTDKHLWAQTYERDLKDVLSLQSEVAGAIAREIQVTLTSQEQAQLANVRAVSPEAYDLYLRGKFHADRIDKANNETAIELLEQAVKIDPNFARGYIELARAYNTRAFTFAPQEKEWSEKASAAVEKALALNPDLAEAHLIRGILLWTHPNHFPHEQAIQEYRRALELNPNFDEAHHQLATVYGHIGLLDEAIQELQKTLAINPSNSLARARMGFYLSYQGKYEQALAIDNSVPKEVWPAVWAFQTSWILFHLGRKDEASARVQEYSREYAAEEGGLLKGMQALLLADAGQERKAEDKIKQAIEIGQGFGHFHHTAYVIASAYALLKKPEPAIRWLEAAADDGFPCYPLFANDTNLDSLRNDERFIAFMAKLKRQWEHYQATL